MQISESSTYTLSILPQLRGENSSSSLGHSRGHVRTIISRTAIGKAPKLNDYEQGTEWTVDCETQAEPFMALSIIEQGTYLRPMTLKVLAASKDSRNIL